MKLHTQRGQFLLDISVILHGIGMGVFFNENGTSKYTAVLPYIKGVSEVLHRCLQQQSVRTVFKPNTTLRPHLVPPKDALEPTKQDGIVITFHVRAAKYTSGKQGERCKKG